MKVGEIENRPFLGPVPFSALGTGDLTDDASLLFDRSENVTVADSVSGTLTYPSRLRHADPHRRDSHGETTVSAGTLQVGDGNAGSLGTGDVTDAAALVFDTTTGNNVTIGNTIDGGGIVDQAGSNTLILTGADGFAGTTTAVEGVLLTGRPGVDHLGKRRPNRRHRSDLHRATLAGDGHVRRLADRVGRPAAHRRPAPPTLPRATPTPLWGVTRLRPPQETQAATRAPRRWR